MACTYLLTLADLPRPPSSGRSHAVEEKAKQRAEDLMNIMPADVDASVNAEPQSDAASSSSDPIKHEIADTMPEAKTNALASRATATATSTTSLEEVLNLHTAGRMKRPSSPSSKIKPGVSIPSQRRWLYYWSLLLVNQGPHGLWTPDVSDDHLSLAPKVRLTHIVVRMRELSGVKANLLRAANAFIDRTGKGKMSGLNGSGGGPTSQVWASLARYDDELVDTLERGERTARAEDGDMGVRRPGSEHQPEGRELRESFADTRWDKGKMVRCFARLGTTGEGAVLKEESSQVRPPLLSVSLLS